MKKVERWGLFETKLKGTCEGNPFTEVEFGAEFKLGYRDVDVDGFYDGDGVYRVRFMPDEEGEWSYVTHSSCPELNEKKGEFLCVAPAEGNRGPVQVAYQYHFSYVDGSPYKQIGTTCYAWAHQPKALRDQTIETLKTSPFNKMRMFLFPKYFKYCQNEPELFPYEKATPAEGKESSWNFSRFDPAFWRMFEEQVARLCELGIEADIIVFHPYDHWGFADMTPEENDLYIRYLVSRLSAHRNVWWSMANEYDLMRNRKNSDWDHYFRLFQQLDPYDHLRSIHNCRGFYDHSLPWVTHCSIQHSDLKRVAEWRRDYGKPVVVDECCYEGDVPHGWGSISAEELVRRFWLGAIGGGYVGHGETYVHPQDILWWSKGGELRGDSPNRLAFLREILEDIPGSGLDPCQPFVSPNEGCARCGDGIYLAYLGVFRPASAQVNLPHGKKFRVDVIDTWNMERQTVHEKAEGKFETPLPGRTGMAILAKAE